MKNTIENILSGGGGPAEPVPYLVSSDWTTKNVRVKAEPVASASLGLRLALNATARACAEERAGIAGLITLRQSLPTYRGCASGTPRRALDSLRHAASRARLCTRQALFRGSARLGLHHGGNPAIPYYNRRGCCDNVTKFDRKH